jgi:diaminohydroxyphosphoribosylaminopyrimidine deaminase/5-amino-6-(5-phosphoribosylamino)uracil reductase
VVAGAGRLPAAAQVLSDDGAAQTIIATTADGARRLRARLGRASPVQLWRFRPAAAPGGRLRLRPLLARLARAGIMHVVCEGGAALAGCLVEEDLIDEYALIYAPAVMGATAALSGVTGTRLGLAEMRRLRFCEVRRLGPDLLVRARPLRGEAKPCSPD